MTPTVYTVARAGTTIGEFTETKILESLRDGTLKPEDYCWAKGFKSWQTIRATITVKHSAKTNLFRSPWVTHLLALLLGALTYAVSSACLSYVALEIKWGGKEYEKGWWDGANQINADWIRESKNTETMKARAEAGDRDGMMDFGICLLFGMRGTVQDVPKGLYYLHRLAAQGDRDACGIISSYYGKQQTQLGKRTPELRAEELKYTALEGTWPDRETIRIWRSHGNWDDQLAEEALRRAKQWAEENGQTVPVSKR